MVGALPCQMTVALEQAFGRKAEHCMPGRMSMPSSPMVQEQNKLVERIQNASAWQPCVHPLSSYCSLDYNCYTAGQHASTSHNSTHANTIHHTKSCEKLPFIQYPTERQMPAAVEEDSTISPDPE